jgi:VCBS repeat-containing protein
LWLKKGAFFLKSMKKTITGFFVLFLFLVPIGLYAVEGPSASANASSFTVAEGSAYVGAVSGNNADGYHFQFVSGSSYGTLTFNSDGSFTYTAHRQPTVGFIASDGFDFRLSDGVNHTEPARVNIAITPVNDAPVAMPKSFSVYNGRTYSGNLAATDDDGDALTYSLYSWPSSGQPSIYYYGGGSFTYTAAPDFSGETFFTYRVHDGLAYSATATVTINVEFPEDEVAPTGHFTISDHFGEVSGEKVYIDVNTQDYDSYVKDVCLWLGDEEENIISPENCQNFSQKSQYSWNYAPSFQFTWDTTAHEDGTYNLYVIATDNAGNQAKFGPTEVIINNYSLGSPVDPAKITTCREFQDINNKKGWHYEIMNNIDCSESRNWNRGEGLTSIVIGGVLNGNNHHISNIYMNTDYTGILSPDTGSLVRGVNFRDTELICKSTYCGGFTHNNWGTIEKSSITGILECSGSCGGFASQQSGTISECWGDMVIGSGGYQGGIAGVNSTGTIINSYFKGKIFAVNGGGLVGLNQGWFSSTGLVKNSYSTAKIESGDWHQNGGMIGWNYESSSQVNSYWNIETSGLENMCGRNDTNCDDANGLTDGEMRDMSSFDGWDFEGTWAIDPEKNDGYPYLQWQTTFTERDTNAPVITLLGSASVNIYLGESYTDAGATALDDRDGDISESIVIDDQVNTDVLGIYKVTYNVSDKAGNKAEEVIRTVKVINKPAPAPVSSGGGGGGLPIFEDKTIPTVFEIYDPVTGITTYGQESEEDEKREEIEEDIEENIEVLGVEFDIDSLDHLHGQSRQIADEVSLSEAEIVYGHNEEEELDEKISNLFEKIIDGHEMENDDKMSVAYFIKFGTKTTKRLGAGERAGVINSYRSAFGKLPSTVKDWQDVIKIANGRWPEEKSAEAEEKAKAEFKKVYLRDADMENPNDNAAVTIMSYGLRPALRNMSSEANAIKTFKAIYKKDPKSATDWDIVRAIAYSGAKR